MNITENALRDVCDRASLFGFLSHELNWPVHEEDTFTYEGPHLDGEVSTRAQVSQIVPFGAQDPFTIMLVEFETAFRRTDLREILRRMREQIRSRAAYQGRKLDEIVFVCATEGYRGLRFAHFATRDRGLPRLHVFGYDCNESDQTRTLREFNLPALAMPSDNLLGEPEWKAGRSRWMTAWNVESVTDGFFKRYKLIFDAAQGHIEGIEGEAKRLFTQRLFNRLLFIRFLERKGWLAINGRRDYLRALWDDYQAQKPNREANFYNGRLRPLFFDALNKPHIRDCRGETILSTIIDDAEDIRDARVCPNIVVQDGALEPVVTDFFYAYNFTVTESTPDDVEVAVDPEMLGKVFEELVTGRHESGSYYTPRPVVAFMCREALKGYLGGFADLVDMHDAASVSVPQATQLIKRLAGIRVVDPACGSGAYLLGMLQELFALTRLLDTRADASTSRDDYARKLSIICNIYGVDIDEFAINIARLRLWLSLVAEYEGETPEPLPNLDFKVECGDSLSAPNPCGGPQPDIFRQKHIEEFETKKSQYADPYHAGDKNAIRNDIACLRREIAAWAHPTETVQGFDWRVEFAEVLGRNAADGRPGGFDVVLANPPYVRMELFKDQKPILRKNFPNAHSERADLYCYFYERAVQLLRQGGALAFISSNKWFRAGYGSGLRKYIAETCHVQSITDFGELPVFQSAATFPMIFIATKGDPHGQTTLFTQVRTLDPPYPDVLRLAVEFGRTISGMPGQGDMWTIANDKADSTTKAMEKIGIPLVRYTHGAIYRGIVTGLNKAFYIDEETRDQLLDDGPEAHDLIKPLVYGDCTRRWHVAGQRKRWVLYVHPGVNISRFPAVYNYLKAFRSDLLKRAGKQAWYELQQPQLNFEHHYQAAKIVFPDICKESRFTLDSEGHYLDNTTTCIASADLFLLAVLNSAPVWSYLSQKCAVLGDADSGGRLRLKTFYVEQMPVPAASAAEKRALSILAQKCLDAKGVCCENWEREIDERVAALYGL